MLSRVGRRHRRTSSASTTAAAAGLLVILMRVLLVELVLLLLLTSMKLGSGRCVVGATLPTPRHTMYMYTRAYNGEKICMESHLDKARDYINTKLHKYINM
jgi:hypothetical protein